MVKRFFKKLTKEKVTIYLLGFIFLTTSFLQYQYGLLDYILGREQSQGFIFDFQTLLAGLLAFGAGIFVYRSTQLKINYEKSKDKETALAFRIYYSKEAHDIVDYVQLLRGALDSNNEAFIEESNIKTLRENFILDNNHILFFKKNEIKLLSSLESSLFHYNNLIELLKNLTKEEKRKPYKNFLNEDNKGFPLLDNLEKIAKKLSASLKKN